MLAKGAYIIAFENEKGENDWIIPVKSRENPLEKSAFLTDYLEVEDYIKKHMSHLRSNLAICKVNELVNVTVNRLIDRPFKDI